MENIEDYEEFVQSNLNKVLITIFYNEETKDYVALFNELLDLKLLSDQDFAFSISTKPIASIAKLPAVYVRSTPDLIAENIFYDYPANLIAPITKLAKEFKDKKSIQRDSYFNRIKRMINENPIMLFIVGTPEKPMCRFTSKLIQRLQPYKLRFGFYDIEADKPMVIYLKEYSGWQTFPQVFIQQQIIGGTDKICELIDSKSFDQLIPKQALMNQVSRLEQIQLLSKFLLLIEGAPDDSSEMAQLLFQYKVPFQFYNLKLDQEVRTEVFNSISDHVDSSIDLEPLLLFRNTIYNITSLINILKENSNFFDQ